jgi:hypothetical protein
MNIRLILLIATLLLAGCAGGGYGRSPGYHQLSGAASTLKRTIEIPPGHATVWLQFGRVTARNAILTPEPHCGFELDTVSDRPQPVMPDRFDIIGARRSVVVSDAGAAADPFMPAFFGGDSPSFMFYQTEFHLRSARQPQVRMLTCTSNQYLPGVFHMRHLTLAEMRAALGDYFSLDLPAAAP